MLTELKNTGKLEPFVLKNYATISFMTGIALYVYSVLNQFYNANAIELKGGREFFLTLFLLVGLAPLTKKTHILKNYGWLLFGTLFLFTHYLIYTCSLNNFSIDYLLGTYVLIFGTILMLNSRILILLFCFLAFIHILEKVLHADINTITQSAIIISISTVFIFSFLVLNVGLRYKKQLLDINHELESKVVTRTKDLEQKAKELNEKNNDLKDFAYILSHDLKQPLRNIYSISEFLIEDYKGKINSDIDNNLMTMKEQVSQMYALIEGVLEYSIQRNNIAHLNLQTLVEKLIALNLNNNCTITILNELPNISFDKTQITQVFQNLINNAIKYNDKEEIIITINYKEEKEQHQFSITDNGPGIEKKYHQKIFELFQKLDNTKKDSTGIGLALVKKIITRNNGTIWIESIPNEGATFLFSLPKT